MQKPINDCYIIAVNQDNTYPVTRESHTVDDVVRPEVQPGLSYLTLGDVVPDGHIIPRNIVSLYRTSRTWGSISTYTWQQLSQKFVW